METGETTSKGDEVLVQTLDALPMGVYLRDLDAHLVHVNPVARALFSAYGVSVDDVADGPRGLFDHLEVVDDDAAPLEPRDLPTYACLRDGGVHTATVGVRPLEDRGQPATARDRQWFHIRAAPAPLPDGRGGVLATYLDVTVQRHLQEELREAALHDPLTGLANRRLLTLRFAQAAATAERDGTRLGLIELDLDRFKLINDTNGHAAGDRLLAEIGGHLLTATREADTAARVGGDEFAVLFTGLEGQAELDVAARRVADAVDGTVAADPRRRAAVGVSAGWCLVARGSDLDGALHEADKAMYQDKARRRSI